MKFTPSKLEDLLKENGIIHHYYCPYSPQQNSKVERKHRDLLNIARAIKLQAALPIRYWGFCILAATHILNRTYSKSLENKIPYEVLHNIKPDILLTKTIGCLCYYDNIKREHKFSTKSRRGDFLGYPQGTKGYTILDIEFQKLIVSRNVIFKKTVFSFKIIKEQSLKSNNNKSTFDNFILYLYKKNHNLHNQEINKSSDQIPNIKPISSNLLNNNSIYA